MPGGPDTYQSYGQGWANASNTPFHLYKHWVHEGGISTPLVAHWPARLRNAGSLNPEPGHLIDIMATCVDVAGGKYPTEYNGNRITQLEGRSLAPCIEGRKRTPHRGLYWEHEGNRAVRDGDWKLVSRYPGKWELFNLRADRTETNDLVAQEPKRAEALAARYDTWAANSQVVSWSDVLAAPKGG